MAAPRKSRSAPKDEFANALNACMPLFWAAGAFSGGVNLLFLASPLYLTQIYNRVIPSGSLNTLVVLSIAVVFAFVTMVFLDSVRARLLIRAGARLDRLLSERVFQTIIDLSVRYGARSRNAQPLRDLDQFRSALAGPASQLFFDAPWTPLFLLVLFLIHPVLGVVGVLGGVALLGLAWLNDLVTRDAVKQSTEAAQRSYAFTESVVRYSDPVHAMGMMGALRGRWMVDRRNMMARQAAGSDRNADFAAVIRFSRLVLQAAMLGLGAWLAIRGDILPASIFAASLVLGRALAPMEQAVAGWRQFGEAITSGRRVQASLSEAPPPPSPTRLPSTDGRLRLSRVSFTPPGAQSPALRNINLEIGAGEAVGLIGPSGAGKSSLARLLVAAAQPNAGKVTLGGVATGRWSREALSHHIGYLPQNVGLFPGSIRDNITRFRDCEDEDVIEAAERAGVHQMILDMPEGYETVIGEGGIGLSGGQRQRIGLARALFGDPKLIVLDEPNAHLDADGEKALAEALGRLKGRGATIVLIAHRLNPLSEVDRVLMLRGGALQLDGPTPEIVSKIRTHAVHSIAPEPAE